MQDGLDGVIWRAGGLQDAFPLLVTHDGDQTERLEVEG